MFQWLTRKSDVKRTASEIYGSIVASARQPTFFSVWGVPDTYEGRFEMLALQTALVMRRLGACGQQGLILSRAVAEIFVIDLDDNMREIGIGDLAVPAKVKRAAAALYDRHRDYGTALEAGDKAALTVAIAAAVSGGAVVAALDPIALADYATRLHAGLAATPDAACLAAALPLPFAA